MTRMKLAFSTLGCPNWDLEQVAQAARDFGYAGIELRAISGSLDLLNRPEFQPDAIAATRQMLGGQGLAVCCVDTSCTFDSPDGSIRHEQVEIAVKHAELAAALGAPLIRVFPDRIQSGATREQTRNNIVACLKDVAQRTPASVRVGLETHGDFARGQAAAEIVRLADHPSLAIIWDVANSMAAGDSIEGSLREVAPHLVHVHLRDARPVEGREHWRPVLAGQGEVSFYGTVAALQSIGYEGYISFEWEKYWHPEIEEPEVALPDFINAVNEWGLAAAERRERRSRFLLNT